MTRTRTFALSTLAFPLFLAAACVEDVGSGQVAAEVAPPAPAAPAADQAQGQAVAIEISRSSVHALGAKLTAQHPIEFDAWEGTLRVEGSELMGVDVTIQMDSLRSDADKLTEHLKSADFFDVAKHPTATFSATGVVAKPGAEGATHEVTGALTLHGVTKQITFPATITGEGGVMDARAVFVIDRQDYGISYPGMPDDLIQDNVLLTIALSADRS